MTSLAVSANALWAVSLGIALVAALIVAFLLIVLVRAVDDIDRSVAGLLDVARSRATLRTSPSSRRPPPCWGRSSMRRSSRTAI
jgi:hypothetical protein